MKHFSLSLLIALSVVLAPFSLAFAQADEDGLPFDLYTTATTSTTTIAIDVLFTVLLLRGGNRSAEEVAAYLEQNVVALQHDLYVGGGETARDLAALLGVKDDELLAFQGYLFEHRAELGELLSAPELTEEILASLWEVLLAAPVEFFA